MAGRPAQVRDECIALCLDCMDLATPQMVYDHVAPALKHASPKTRQSALVVLAQLLEKWVSPLLRPRRAPGVDGRAGRRYGQAAVKVSTHLGTLAGLLSDRDAGVREAAVVALVETYRQVGEAVRRDVGRHGVPQTKLGPLLERFDAVERSGTMAAPASSSGRADSGKSTRSVKSSGLGRSRAPASEVARAGGVDPADFERAMYDAAPVVMGSAHELEGEFAKFNKLVSDDRADWEARVNANKRIRGLVAGQADGEPPFVELVRDAAGTFAAGIRDLRSQVSKETCITVALLSNVLGTRFEAVAKVCAPVLLKQCSINVKVMSQSASLCLNHMFESVQSTKLVDVLARYQPDKSVAIRQVVIALLVRIAEVWDTEVLRRPVVTVLSILERAISDANGDVRVSARRGFWAIEAHFEQQAVSPPPPPRCTYLRALTRRKGRYDAAPGRQKAEASHSGA